MNVLFLQEHKATFSVVITVEILIELAYGLRGEGFVRTVDERQWHGFL